MIMVGAVLAVNAIEMDRQVAMAAAAKAVKMATSAK